MAFEAVPMVRTPTEKRLCLREPLASQFWAAFKLEEAVGAHLGGDYQRAARLIAATDLDEFRLYLRSLWGPYSEHNSPIDGVRITHASSISRDKRPKLRMPGVALLREVIERDGYKCRYCAVPVVPKAVRSALHKFYPLELPWGRKEVDQHAGLQALWMQFDHILPHSMGGENAVDNIVVSCAGCNFGKSNYSLEQLGLEHPFERPPIATRWTGLTQLLEGRNE